MVLASSSRIIGVCKKILVLESNSEVGHSGLELGHVSKMQMNV